MEHRPFADNDMHSRQFGRSTSSTKDLNRKAAGTTHYHHTQATRRANAPHSTAKIHVGATMGATIGTTKLTVAPHKCTLKLKFF